MIKYGLQIREGDYLVAARPGGGTEARERPIFAVAIISSIEGPLEDGSRRAHLADWKYLTPPRSYDDIGGDPRRIQRDALARMPVEVAVELSAENGTPVSEPTQPIEEGEVPQAPAAPPPARPRRGAISAREHPAPLGPTPDATHSPETFAEAFDRILSGIDLEVSSNARFEELWGLVSDYLKLDKEDLYLFGGASRVTNIPIRATQGRASFRHKKVGLHPLLHGEWLDDAKKYATELTDYGQNYDAFGYARVEDGKWVVTYLVERQGSKVGERLLDAFPRMDVIGRTDVAVESGGRNPAKEFALGPIEDLTVEQIRKALDDARLTVPDELPYQVHAALAAGKHLLLEGAPGTGKTTFAIALGNAARAAGVATGAVVTTGSSEWTPSDTVGTYRLDRETKDLEFSPGQVLQAIADGQWVVLDELNRADIDRAIGPLFTVLARHLSVLRFEVGRPPNTRKVAIVPWDVAAPDNTAAYVVPPGWRVIATMNTRDQDKLFEVSQALLRRFAIITLKAPPNAEHAALLSQFATKDPLLDKGVADSVGFGLGPAITMDFADYVRRRSLNAPAGGGAGNPAQILREGYRLILEPQLAGLPASVRKDAEARYLGAPAMNEPKVDADTGVAEEAE